MNILFFYTETIDPYRGGVERVTHTLAEYFIRNGHHVFVLGQHKNGASLPYQYFLPNSKKLITEENIDFLRAFIQDNSINVIINQGALFEESAKFINTICNTEVKIFSVIHNSILATVQNAYVVYGVKLKKLHLEFIVHLLQFKVIKRFICIIYKLKKRNHYRNLIKNSKYLILLSEAFFPELKDIVGDISFNNVIAIANPTVFTNDKSAKEKIVLYVGRINKVQKRVDILLDVWSKVYHKNTDWVLKVVGDGESLSELKGVVKAQNIRNITFEGVQDPKSYYDVASIFCLTSSFEGLPMTLIEAMSHKVVPVIFNSFATAPQMIKNGVSGCLVTAFDVDEYCEALSNLMSNQNLLTSLSNEAYNASLSYDIDIIGQKWIKLFKE